MAQLNLPTTYRTIGDRYLIAPDPPRSGVEFTSLTIFDTQTGIYYRSSALFEFDDGFVELNIRLDGKDIFVTDEKAIEMTRQLVGIVMLNASSFVYPEDTQKMGERIDRVIEAMESILTKLHQAGINTATEPINNIRDDYLPY